MLKRILWSARDKTRGILYIDCRHCGEEICLKFNSTSDDSNPGRFGIYKITSGDSVQNISFEQEIKLSPHFNSYLRNGELS